MTRSAIRRQRGVAGAGPPCRDPAASGPSSGKLNEGKEASTMCYDDNARPPVPPGVGGATSAEDLVLTAADGNRFAAYRSVPDGPAQAQALIFPDVRGLH